MTETIKPTASEIPNIWKRRLTMERGWTVIAVSVFLLHVGSAISIDAVESGSRSWIAASTSSPNSMGNRPSANIVQTVATQAVDRDVCYSPGCIETASSVIKNMDTSVDPCDDFYKFSCGGFINSTIIPADEVGVDAAKIITDKLHEQLRASFESESGPEEPKHFKLVKDLYKSCMNDTAIEALGLEPLRNLLKKLGGWPVLDGAQWDEDVFDWKTMMAKFRDAGYHIHPFINIDIRPDPYRSTRRAIALILGAVGLNQKYIEKGFDDQLVQAYYRYMIDVAVIMGADKDLAKTELKESLLFAIELANISLPTEERRYDRMTLTEFTKNTNFPLKEYLTNVMPRNISINDDDIVLVIPRPIIGLVQLMSNTPKRVQANHAMWVVTEKMIGFLNDELRKRRGEFLQVLYGLTKREPRWKTCLVAVSGVFPHNVGAMYVKKYFDRQAKRDVDEMVANIRKQFVKTLEQVEWMDEETRQRALEKANATKSYIGYPDELLDDRKVELLHDNLKLSEDHYFGNMFNISRFYNEKMFAELRKPVNKSEWFKRGGAATVNAHYKLFDNVMEFPAGILQGAFFRHDRPKYMNYGGIGFIIGHEIIHGFDDKGRLLDKNGDIFNWWKQSTSAEYFRRKECIIDQYKNYGIEVNGTTHNLNGISTQGENIADNGGMKLAYFAYNDWLERNKTDQQLPGLDYTPRQMFWISNANAWCAKYRPEFLKNAIATDTHSPKEFRVLGPLSNTPEFAKDFNCSLGSKMNPVKKCSLW